jgi:REP element-mobilizing transposase RayT
MPSSPRASGPRTRPIAEQRDVPVRRRVRRTSGFAGHGRLRAASALGRANRIGILVATLENIIKIAMLNQMSTSSPAESSRQLKLPFRKRGGARKGAGRKPRADRVDFVPHVARSKHSVHVPVHITARTVAAAPSLRSERIYEALRGIFAAVSEKGFRLVHFSVQGNHLHMIVEGDDDVALTRGVQRLLSRVAMMVNAMTGRSGRLWRDRHHRHPLRTPSEVRNAYVYVLFNFRKHQVEGTADWHRARVSYDPCSSHVWFDGWRASAQPAEETIARAGPRVVERARSWLAREGWRRRGLLRRDEVPRS